MLTDYISHCFSSYDGMVVVGETVDASHTGALARKTRADVVISVAETHSATDWQTILFARPKMRIFTVDLEQNRCTQHDLRLCKTTLGEVSQAALIDAIRSGKDSAR